MQEIISKFDGRVGLCFEELDGTVYEAIDTGSIYPTASVIKIFVLGALLEQCRKGNCSMEDLISVDNVDHVGGTGVLKEFKSDTQIKVYDMAMLMIIVSDNVATNHLVDYLGGVWNINAFIRSCGLEKTVMNRKISADPRVTRSVLLGVTTPAETIDYLRRIYTGELLGKKEKEIFLDIMGRQQLNNSFVRKLTGIKAAHKTGSFEGAKNDVGYLFADDKVYLFSAFTDGSREWDTGCDSEGYVLLGKLGRYCFDTYRKK